MSVFNSTRKCLALVLIALPLATNAATINFDGPLVVTDLDLGGAIYSGTPLGTQFTGDIDDVTFGGSITDAATVTTTAFSCCIAAGSLGLSNDIVLAADDAALLNAVAGFELFAENDVVDGVDIEGDANTNSGGRIEVGLSYVLRPDAFADESPGNYPFDADDVLLELYFILEENSAGGDIYSGIGRVSVIPLPATAWLFGAGLLTLLSTVRRKLATTDRE